jgi:hypothetical protein
MGEGTLTGPCQYQGQLGSRPAEVGGMRSVFSELHGMPQQEGALQTHRRRAAHVPRPSARRCDCACNAHSPDHNGTRALGGREAPCGGSSRSA